MVGLSSDGAAEASAWIINDFVPYLITHPHSQVSHGATDPELAIVACRDALGSFVRADWIQAGLRAKSAIDLVPESSSAWLILAGATEHIGTRDAAIEALMSAVCLNPYAIPGRFQTKAELPSTALPSEAEFTRVGNRLQYFVTEFGLSPAAGPLTAPASEVRQIACASDGENKGHVVALFDEDSKLPLVKHHFLLCFDSEQDRLLWKAQVDGKERLVAVSPRLVISVNTGSAAAAFRLRDARSGVELRVLTEAEFHDLIWPTWPDAEWQDGYRAANSSLDVHLRNNRAGYIIDPWRTHRRYAGINAKMAVPQRIPVGDDHSGWHVTEVQAEKGVGLLTILNDWPVASPNTLSDGL
jgi:hypothetical protein